jgi:DNA helicase II / ATP-dependent DNA helicase PcrA
MPNRQTNSCALQKLNREQRKAATYGIKDGLATQHRPLLIVAGAGTGKTETMAMRTGNLIACGARPSEMFVAVFTRRAAKALVARAQMAIKATKPGATVHLPYAGTFHSIAYSLLNEFGAAVGVKKSFTILDRDDAKDLMDRVRARSGQINQKETFPQTEVCCAIHSYSRNACLSLKATLRKRYPGLKQHAKPLAQIMRAYAKAKRARNAVDYDDLLELLVSLLQHPKVGARLRKRFQFVLVDEFQDTNRLQFKILKLLKPSGRGVTVVGDDAQAIYSFRAATVKNIREYPNSFDCSAKVISLTRNYRSTGPILKASNAVMSLASGAFKKELWSKRKSRQRPFLTTVMDENEQARHVTDTILDLRERGIPLKEQAVLIRASQHSLALEVALEQADIPYQKWGGLKFLESAHIKDFMAVLKWWQNPRDQIAGFRALTLLEGIGKATADRLVEALSGSRLLERFLNVDVPRAATKQWARLGKLLRRLEKSDWPSSLEETLRWYRPHLKRLYDDNQEGRLADLEQLVALGATFESCRQFLAELALEPPGQLAEQKLSKDDTDNVLTLSTIHSAKGCEWKAVTVLSVMDGCIPSSKCRNENEIEEERRLLYVAMTRARDRLELVLPRRNFQPSARNIPAATIYSRPSRFIPGEILGHFKRTTHTCI